MAQLKDTVISGNLRVTDTIYGHNPHHVYYVKSLFGVDERTTLKIEPGTRLEFAKDAGLYAFGNPHDPVKHQPRLTDLR